MNGILRLRCLSLAMAVALAGISGSALAQTKTVKVVPVHQSNAWTGSEMFHEYCAVCHGVDAKGGGPAAEALKQRPTDLTQITRRNSGKFPALHMQLVIQGKTDIAAHGNAEMPPWGDAFRSISASQSFAEMRVQALVRYLEEIQR